MYAESTIKPKSHDVENCGGVAEVVLYENVTKQTRTESETGEVTTYYTYDEYRMNVPFRDNLPQEVGDHREAWLAAAKQAEETAKEKKTLEDEIASLKADNEIMGAALEEVIAVIAGGVE